MAAIVDADHFKRINDTLSHEVGDRVIRELARVLQQTVSAAADRTAGASGLVARIGGEEFLVLLPGLDLPGATRVLRKVCGAVATHEWSPLIGDLPVRVSIGASAAAPGDTQLTLLARADHHLDAAKAGGRNRVVVGDEAPVQAECPRRSRRSRRPGRAATRRQAAADAAADGLPSWQGPAGRVA